MRKRKVKAWAVVHKQYSFEDVFGDSEDRSPLFNKYSDALCSKWQSEDYYRRKGMVKIIPCTITYSLPPNKKRGGK